MRQKRDYVALQTCPAGWSTRRKQAILVHSQSPPADHSHSGFCSAAASSATLANP
ncbi:hypothetical protein CGMCC3_g6628 [Colletotrichum fructicola]|nr:uncharacterized protein CGMCC3_g6628 [Colletotrichum fructicola]KAE9577365.1 hypothetical protein CGMCC3_g6628 [Colletotrichum fructicola]